jgi:hypothetical protein
LGSVVTNNVIYTCKSKSRVAIRKSGVQQEDSIHEQNGLKFEEETSKVLHLEPSFEGCRNLDTSEKRSVILRKL